MAALAAMAPAARPLAAPAAPARGSGRRWLTVYASAGCGALLAFWGACFANPARLGQRLGREGVQGITMRATKQLERTKAATEWRLNVGHAVDVLRADNVALFDDPTHAIDFSIFSPDVEMVDARLPGFHLQGLDAYRKLLQSLQWSMSVACESARLEITAMPPPINNNVYMRWILDLVPRDVMAPAKGFLQPLGTANPLLFSRAAPVTVEGYSRYEFDPWSAKIIRHSVEITNPPTSLNQLLQQYTTGFMWARAPAFVRIPQVVGAPLSTGYGAVALGHAGAVAPFPAGRSGSRVARAAFGMPNLPRGCEDDFECNDGKANFPLQCCELPVVGKFCCKPEDFGSDGGLPVRSDPLYVALPVPVDPLPPGPLPQ